ncbi:MAG: cell division protein ZapA [Oscillospiraceae bacterium]|jgi:cell division protein ZapA|nr:cell division protein ZapA [Oscillospiraceae bacterium]
MNKIKIVLSGKEYTIQTDESVSYVTQLAESLDAKIEEYMNQNDSISVTSACMLVSLGLMDDCIKASSDKDNLRKQVIDYLEEATRSRNEITELKKENEALRQQIELMKVKLLAYGDKEFANDGKDGKSRA